MGRDGGSESSESDENAAVAPKKASIWSVAAEAMAGEFKTDWGKINFWGLLLVFGIASFGDVAKYTVNIVGQAVSINVKPASDHLIELVLIFIAFTLICMIFLAVDSHIRARNSNSR